MRHERFQPVGSAELDVVVQQTQHLATRALDGLTIEVPKGIVFGFLGPNGSGKTTTIRILLGLLEPTSGSAEVLGFDTRRNPDDIRLRCGSLLEHAGIYEGLSAEDNLSLYGERPGSSGHGHNYVLEVTLRGEPDPDTGMVYDLKRLKDVVECEVIEPMDHRHLNHEVPPFDHILPTAENLAKEIWRRLEPKLRLPSARLESIRVYETEDLWVEYSE